MRAVIAEDDTLLREGLVSLLGPEGIEVVAASADVVGFSATVLDQRADLAIVDVRMPPTWTNEGIQAAVDLRRRRPGFPVVVLSAHVETRFVGDLLADDAGGIGYLLKERVGAVADFVESLRRVAAGGTVLDPEVVTALIRRRKSPLEALTEREREVLELIARGDGNREIAAALHVTEAAVLKHVRNIFLKLGLLADDTRHRRVVAALTYLNQQ
ncbi:response regulator [Streptosporangium lutulentum]|uniref:DNA-binding NarL/FixJ family response regulator n=1 Tax=Streptosporangium lutulentum TaxID=1461250 RepID=A0ABT9Q8R9_9ACTN|nr:response regulator transcription factor [Streptosporangium lutulentum]MDP9843147.1 DNA-binding NarL/FixJ family response regulator [Streptosporangium lutulentum]